MAEAGINSVLERYFNIAKVLLAVTPFIGLFYITMQGNVVNGDMTQILAQNPKLTILFLVCMINPFIAYLLMFVQKKIEEGDLSYAVINLAILVAAEVILQNMIFAMLLGLIFYKIKKIYAVSLKECFDRKGKKNILRTVSGSIVVFLLSCFCLFAQSRIGF